MKLIFVAEDAIVGMICGLLLIGSTGRWFSLKLSPWIYIAAFVIFIFFIILDIAHEISDLTTHFGFIMLSLIHNIIDVVLSLAFISHFSGWKIPYITSTIVPYLQSEVVIFYVGVFLVVANGIWLLVFPMTY